MDTGSVSTVDFCSPAVAKYHLLDPKKATASLTGGAGGTAQSWVGVVDWFDLAGNRFEKPSVGFQVAKVGAFATPYTDGNIGMGLMGKFQIFLDYSHQRVAFLRQTP